MCMNSKTHTYLPSEWYTNMKILDALDTPKLVYNTSIIEKNINIFTTALNNNVDAYYSVKANNNQHILDYIYKKGLGFEVASMLEIERLKTLGVPSNQIIFGAPVKISEHIRRAYKLGVLTYAVDSLTEIEKVSALAPYSKIYIRVDTSNDGATWSLNEKFGIPEEDVLELAKSAISMKLRPIGLTYAMGWNNGNAKLWGENLGRIVRLTKQLIMEGIHLQFVDLGGGFPSHLVEKQQVFNEISKAVNPLIHELKTSVNVKTIAEPGSFIVSDAGVMLASIIAKRKKNDKWWLFLDTGIMQGFPWIHSNLQYAITSLHTSSNPKMTPFIITGPTCDSHDVFNTACMLDINIKIGDKVIIFPAGGYIESSTAYSGFMLPQSFIISE